MTVLSRPPPSTSWLTERFRFRLNLLRSLSKTSPDRNAETRSSNSPPTSSVAPPFLARRSRSLCSFSWKKIKETVTIEKIGIHLVSCSFSGVSHHGLHPCPPLFLLLAPLHVFQVLPCFAERLQEGVENPEKVIGLHPPFFFPKVLKRFGELQ